MSIFAKKGGGGFRRVYCMLYVEGEADILHHMTSTELTSPLRVRVDFPGLQADLGTSRSGYELTRNILKLWLPPVK